MPSRKRKSVRLHLVNDLEAISKGTARQSPDELLTNARDVGLELRVVERSDFGRDLLGSFASNSDVILRR